MGSCRVPVIPAQPGGPGDSGLFAPHAMDVSHALCFDGTPGTLSDAPHLGHSPSGCGGPVDRVKSGEDCRARLPDPAPLSRLHDSCL